MGVVERGSLILTLNRKIETGYLHWRKVLVVLPLLIHNVVGKEVPEIQTNFEKLFVLDAAHLRQICQALESLVAQHLYLVVGLNCIGQTFNKVEVIF